MLLEWIKSISKYIDLPWLLIGDFNQIFNWDDKSGRKGSCSTMNDFLECLNGAHLIRITQQGPAFTCTNNRSGSDNVMEKLGISFCKLEWLHTFPSSFVNTLPLAASDHYSPILLYTECIIVLKKKLRRFENYWLKYKEYSEIVQDFWRQESQASPTFLVHN